MRVQTWEARDFSRVRFTVVKVLLFSALVVLGAFVVFGLFGNGFDVPALIRGFVEATDGDDFNV